MHTPDHTGQTDTTRMAVLNAASSSEKPAAKLWEGMRLSLFTQWPSRSIIQKVYLAVDLMGLT